MEASPMWSLRRFLWARVSFAVGSLIMITGLMGTDLGDDSLDGRWLLVAVEIHG
jgi:hypothetical protein